MEKKWISPKDITRMSINKDDKVVHLILLLDEKGEALLYTNSPVGEVNPAYVFSKPECVVNLCDAILKARAEGSDELLCISDFNVRLIEQFEDKIPAHPAVKAIEVAAVPAPAIPEAPKVIPSKQEKIDAAKLEAQDNAEIRAPEPAAKTSVIPSEQAKVDEEKKKADQAKLEEEKVAEAKKKTDAKNSARPSGQRPSMAGIVEKAEKQEAEEIKKTENIKPESSVPASS